MTDVLRRYDDRLAHFASLSSRDIRALVQGRSIEDADTATLELLEPWVS